MIQKMQVLDGAAVWSSPTIKERSISVDHRSTGFDYMRIVLSTAIICFHSVSISYGPAAEEALRKTIAGPFFAAIVPMFFALSGYMVASSLDRCPTLVSFLGLRVLRICPALAVETLLSAFILGPIFTTYSLTAYWSDPMLWTYVRNSYGDIQYTLPGVFANLPKPYKVNGQLWTIKPELFCYAAMAVIAMLGVKRRPMLIPAAFVFMLIGVVLLKSFFHIEAPTELGGAWSQVVGLVVVFLMGVALHVYRDRLPWSHGLGAVSIVSSLTLLCFPHGQFLASAPLSYATVYLGLFNPKKVSLLGGDYSYGMYLYGFVIQQAFAALGDWARVWWLSCLVCVPAAWLMAYVSWHGVEKPAQSLRTYLKRAEAALVRRFPALVN